MSKLLFIILLLSVLVTTSCITTTDSSAVKSLASRMSAVENQLSKLSTVAIVSSPSSSAPVASPDLTDYRQRLSAVEGQLAMLKSRQDTLERNVVTSTTMRQDSTAGELASLRAAVMSANSEVSSIKYSLAAITTRLVAVESKLGIVP